MFRLILPLCHIINISKMDYSNLIQPPCEFSQANRMTYKYTRDELVQIGKHVEDRTCTVRLSGWTCARIRSLNIQKRPRRRGTRAGVMRKLNSLERRQVNHNLLVNIRLQNEFSILRSLQKTNISMALMNSRSIKGKDTLIVDQMLRGNIDLMAITETWLKPECNSEWCKMNSFTQSGLHIISLPRQGAKRGGGVALAFGDNIKCVQMLLEEDKVFWQYALFRIETKSKHILHALIVYHPPSTKGFPNSVFVSDFLEITAEITMNYKNIVIAGDFNMHMEDETNEEVCQFIQDLEIMGMQQSVHFFTHRQGHTLDLVITDKDEMPNINCVPGDFLSDHRLILFTLPFEKLGSFTRKRITKVDTSNITIDELLEEVNLKDISRESVNQMWEEIKAELECAMRKLTSVSEKLVTDRRKVPWMNEYVKKQKKVVNRREKIWRKYGKDEHWTALMTERKLYKKLICQNKQHHKQDTGLWERLKSPVHTHLKSYRY